MKLSWAGMIAVVCSVPLSAATVTLSQAGILALDWRESVHSTSILSATPRADGVEYEVAFASNRDPSVELVSSVSGGKGAFVGLPWKSGDSFALRFTLLSSAPGPEAYVSAGALISIRDMAAQAPVRLGGNRPQTGISNMPTEARVIKTIGFEVYIAPANASAWPAQGGTIRLLVEPAPDAAIMAPPPDSTYRQRFDAATLTLSQSDILEFRKMGTLSKSPPKTSILGQPAKDGGVEYTITFSDHESYAYLEFPRNGISPFGRLPPSIEHFALRFTLLSSTAGPGATLEADVQIQDGRTRFQRVQLGYDGSSSPVEVNTNMDAGTAKSVVVSVHEKLGYDAKPLYGQTVRLLVEPSPHAVLASAVAVRE